MPRVLEKNKYRGRQRRMIRTILPKLAALIGSPLNANNPILDGGSTAAATTVLLRCNAALLEKREIVIN